MKFIQPMMTKRSLKRIRYVLLVILAIIIFPAVALAAPPSPLNPASPAARSIANLHTITLVIASLVFLIVCGLLIYSIIRFRRKSPDDPEPDQSFHGSVMLETIWTVIPVGILLVILVLTFQTFQDIDPNRPTDMTIKVIGKQWLWEVQYPDHNIKLTNEIRIPANTDVRIELEATDVIHSFWVPQLMGKTDAVPGYLTQTWLHAERPGTFRGQCAEFCGLAHANMYFDVIAMDQQSFDLWVSTTAEQQGNVGAQGQLIFSANCSSCHSINGEGGQIGPELTNVYADKGEDYIRESIMTPNAVIAPLCPTGPCQPNIMPQTFSEILSEQDINNIVAYLQEASGVEE